MFRFSRLFFAIPLLLVVAFSATVSFAAPPIKRAAKPNKGTYLVAFKGEGRQNPAETSARLAERFGGTIRHVYRAFPGMAITLPEPAAEAMSKHASVGFIEEDAVGSVAALYSKSTIGPSGRNYWYLDRIDEAPVFAGQTEVQSAYPLSTTFDYSSRGAGVSIYIVDTGVWDAESQFAGRLRAGPDFASPSTPQSVNPCGEAFSPFQFRWSHGTAVASIAAGERHGVADRATIVSVRVADCEGNFSGADLAAALDWIMADGRRPAIVNMSLWVDDSLWVVENLLLDLNDVGIVAVTSANNFCDDACQRVPARLARSGPGVFTPDENGNVPTCPIPGTVISVGGTMAGADGGGSLSSTFTRDYRWQESLPESVAECGSCYGACVDISAPAKNIHALHYDGTDRLLNSAGTSFAAPQVAGAAARYLSGFLFDPANTNATMPQRVWNWLTTESEKQTKVLDSRGSGKMLYVSPAY